MEAFSLAPAPCRLHADCIEVLEENGQAKQTRRVTAPRIRGPCVAVACKGERVSRQGVHAYQTSSAIFLCHVQTSSCPLSSLPWADTCGWPSSLACGTVGFGRSVGLGVPLERAGNTRHLPPYPGRNGNGWMWQKPLRMLLMHTEAFPNLARHATSTYSLTRNAGMQGMRDAAACACGASAGACIDNVRSSRAEQRRPSISQLPVRALSGPRGLHD